MGGPGGAAMSVGGISEYEERGHAVFMLFGRMLELLGMVASALQMSVGSVVHFMGSLVGFQEHVKQLNNNNSNNNTGRQIGEKSRRGSLQQQKVGGTSSSSSKVSFWARTGKKWLRRVLMLGLVYVLLGKLFVRNFTILPSRGASSATLEAAFSN
eukprot:PhM_4_TR10559/c1_g1_i1/m.60562